VQPARVDPPIVQAMPGCIVTRVAVDDSFTLTLCGIDREILLRIDGSGEIGSGQARSAFDPDRDPLSVTALLRLLNRHVDSARIESDGSLLLDCGGDELHVQPSDHSVSWSLKGPDGTRASCLAEGRVVWE
jgi:hypothetical protein